MANTLDLKSLTTELIAFRSTADRPTERRLCLDYLKSLFSDTRLTIEEFSKNGIDSLFIHKGNRNPRVLLFGHYDVVDGEESQFSAVEHDGRIYGRGALDMKSGIAALVSLMIEAENQDWDVALALTGDEETGGFNGIKTILESDVRPGCVILPDGGKAPQNIVHKEKGVLWIKISACGKPAHGSAPWNGVSAITVLRKALDKLESVFTPLAEHPSDHWVTTCSIGKIEGGSALNKVPETACAYCDIRYTENENPEQIIEKINKTLPEGISIEIQLNEPLVFVDPEDPKIKNYLSCIRDTGSEPSFTLDFGSSDARFFTPQGIPVILSQPLGDGHHGPLEWVDIVSIGKYSEIVKKFLNQMSRA